MGLYACKSDLLDHDCLRFFCCLLSYWMVAMWKVVVCNTADDEPGVCYSGFSDKKHVIDWLKEYNLYGSPYRWIIFKQEIAING